MENYEKTNKKIEEQLEYIRKMEKFAEEASVEDKIWCYEPKILEAYDEIQRIIKREIFKTK